VRNVTRALVAALVVSAGGAVVSAPAAAMPGQVAAGTEVDVIAEGFGPGAAGLGDDAYRSQEAVDGVASSTYRYPRTGGAPWGGAFTCPSTGCGSWDASAHGYIDVHAGRLEASSWAAMLVGGTEADNAGYSQVSGRSYLDDTVTLSAPATLLLRGTARVELDASHTHIDWYGDPDGVFDVGVAVTTPAEPDGPESPPWRYVGGFEEELEADVSGCPYPSTCGADPSLPVSEPVVTELPFSVEVELPAGTSYVNAWADADVDLLLWGAQGDEHRSWHAQSALVDGTLTFELVVPDGVTATSGSGRLPLVGGAGPVDTTAPVVTPPADVQATAGASCDADVDPGTATAEDDGQAVPTTAERSDGLALTAPYPLGATTVTWSATDAAGNVGTADQVVTVIDSTPPALTVPDDVTVEVGADVTEVVLDPGTATATDACGTPAVTGERADGATLTDAYPVGSTAITWQAVDAAGNTSSGQQTVTVVRAEEADASVEERIDELRGTIEGFGLAKGDTGRLVGRLDRILADLDRGHLAKACGALDDLLADVGRLETVRGGRAMTSAQAAAVRDAVASIRAAAGCETVTRPGRGR
jgi:hypothetical protein